MPTHQPDQPDHREHDELARTVTLSKAKQIVTALAAKQSVLMLSAPGVGKSDAVVQAASDAGLPCRSLLGTQIAPEDVSGIPRIVGERSVFCPPRILLPESNEPFCLFLDELPACSPEIQKAFYSILLERRIGEYKLPAGSWVVAAGNRSEDRSLVRSLSMALVNRVFMINIAVDHAEWIRWAIASGIRGEVIAFLQFRPEALMRPVPNVPVPFSTPRAWASLSQALDEIESALGKIPADIRRSLTFGRVSGIDAVVFCAMVEEEIHRIGSIDDYIQYPTRLPEKSSALWFVLHRIRELVTAGLLTKHPPECINNFLQAITEENRLALITGLVAEWSRLGTDQVMFETLLRITGLENCDPLDDE